MTYTFVRLVFLSLYALLLFSAPSFAQINLNIGQAPLTEQTSKARAVATKQALQQVLVKLSGSSIVLEDKDVKSLLNNAQQYVVASRFIASPFTGLEVQFNQARLEQWLKQQQMPLWGAQRPSALLWLAYQNPVDNQRVVINATSEHPIKAELLDAAAQRAVPITLPIYDLQDIEQVAEIDVWAQFVDPLYYASERYNSDVTLAARIYANADLMWQLDGFVKDGDLLRLTSFVGVETSAVLQDFINFYTEIIAQRDAIDTRLFAVNERIEVNINVEGVTSLGTLAELNTLFSSLSVVDKFMHAEQIGDNSLFKLRLLSTPERLQSFLDSSPNLDVVDYDSGNHNTISADARVSLRYRWIN